MQHRPKILELFDIPPQVDLKVINWENGSLVTTEEVKANEEKLKALPNGRHSKSILGGRYGFIKTHGKIFDVYDGKQKGRHLGEGGFGVVKLAFDRATGAWVTAKIFKDREKDGSPKDGLVEAQAELKQLQELKREKCPEVYTKTSKNGFNKHTLLMKYESGVNLRQYQEKNPDLSSIEIATIIIGMVSALREFHKTHFHLDVKLRNFIYNPLTKKIVIVDLGLAVAHSQQKHIELEILMGTPHHYAPELLAAKKLKQPKCFNAQTDTYALGIAIKRLLGAEYSEINDRSKYLSQIKQTYYQSSKILKFLDEMTARDPSSRPTLKKAEQFFNEVKNNLAPPMKREDIVLLDINHFLVLPTKEKKDLVIELKSDYKPDGVIFIAKNVDRFTLQFYKREIELIGIRVKKKVYENKEDIGFEESKGQQLYVIDYNSKNSQLNAENVILNIDMQKYINHLRKEIDLLGFNEASIRIAENLSYWHALHDNAELTYKRLLKEIDDLVPKSYLGFFGGDSDLSALKKMIEKDIKRNLLVSYTPPLPSHPAKNSSPC